MLSVSLFNSKRSRRDSTCGCEYYELPGVSKIYTLRHFFSIFDGVSPACHKAWSVYLYAARSPWPAVVTHSASSDGTHDDEPSGHHIWWSWTYRASSDSSVRSRSWFRRWRSGLMSGQITASAVHAVAPLVTSHTHPMVVMFKRPVNLWHTRDRYQDVENGCIIHTRHGPKYISRTGRCQGFDRIKNITNNCIGDRVWQLHWYLGWHYCCVVDQISESILSDRPNMAPGSFHSYFYCCRTHAVEKCRSCCQLSGKYETCPANLPEINDSLCKGMDVYDGDQAQPEAHGSRSVTSRSTRYNLKY